MLAIWLKNGENVRNKTVIIGGGFYGLSVALYLYDNLGVKNIDILEKEKQPKEGCLSYSKVNATIAAFDLKSRAGFISNSKSPSPETPK